MLSQMVNYRYGDNRERAIRSCKELHSDIQALEDMLTDDYIGVGPLGFMLTKEQWLERHASGALTYTSFVVEDIKLRIYKDTAIAIGREVAQGSYKGQSIPGNFRITLIFIKQHDTGLIAGQHLSPIGEPMMMKPQL